ncbi:unnamed protein product [Pleuronectes platessa]|uniref:Uncharacterized protein n=1 Tax=Pleuronectes platessa TaxID=8262 RepID=A0A9N7UH24_PLEPL|nr:unnamed protein product [Pleuronectes platessa]
MDMNPLPDRHTLLVSQLKSTTGRLLPLINHNTQSAPIVLATYTTAKDIQPGNPITLCGARESIPSSVNLNKYQGTPTAEGLPLSRVSPQIKFSVFLPEIAATVDSHPGSAGGGSSGWQPRLGLSQYELQP